MPKSRASSADNVGRQLRERHAVIEPPRSLEGVETAKLKHVALELARHSGEQTRRWEIL
jgi:hypothetical protein